ncbi:MAG: cytochrome C [Hyphomicrobiales bacterium]|nr:cytochrome C [Hyphomicrobiales bacterium]
MTKFILVLASSVFVLATPIVSVTANAESFPPIENQTVIAECGECHMVFFAEMLPRKSWLRILNSLGNHYGEDASIDSGPLKEIITFHTSRASDVLNIRGAIKWREGLNKGEAPERITTAPRFIRKHADNDFAQMWTKFKVASKADCLACHKGATRGQFDDD